MQRWVVWPAVILLAAGCEGRRGDSAEEDRVVRVEVPVDTAAADTAVEREVRPSDKRVPISIEGVEEEMRLVLYESPSDFPLVFSTYIPEDMAAERWRGTEGDAVAFVAVLGGQRNEAAAMRMIVHRAGATEYEVVEILTELARDLGTDLEAPPNGPRFDWSVREFRNVAHPAREDAAQGFMGIGRRDNRYYTIAIHYPAEYGDGFGPRANRILQEWRWTH